MMKKEYEYYAFISYKRTDEKWAKWLQRKLETYRFPVTLRKNHQSLPKRLFPVFRDKTDLSSGMLWEELKKRLEESEYLIVICSPESAQAPWVNEEVSYFQSLGRHDRIIPLIVDGEPHAADSSRECFCPALRSSQGDELLGVSVPEFGKRNTLLRVIASIMKIKYDQLAMRDRKRRQKRAALLTTVGALAAAATFAIAWYNIPHTAYYWSYVYRNEVPEGYCKMTKAERERAYASFKIITQRGKVVRLENVNSMDIPDDCVYDEIDNYGYPIIEFTYTQRGEIATAIFKDADDEPQLIKSYEGIGAVNLINPQNTSLISSISSDVDPQGFLSAAIEVSESGPEISRMLLDHDENGFLIRERYMWNNLNMPACDSDGFYGYQYTLDENGKPIRQVALGSDFEPLDSFTNCVAVRSFNERGQLTSLANYSASEDPVLDDGRVHRYEFAYGDSGSLVSIKCYGTDDLPCNTLHGISETRYQYDAQGLKTDISYYDESGQPAYSTDNGVHRTVYAYDDQQFMYKEAYQDADGHPMYDTNGISSIVYSADAQSGIVSQYYYDTDGNPTYLSGSMLNATSANQFLWSEGAATTTRYGQPLCAAGMIVETPNKLFQRITYLNTDHEPALNYFGYAIVEITFNENGMLERQSFFDAEGKPIRAVYNAASILYRYNDASQLVSISYYGEDGQPCYNIYGTAQARILYDYSGRPSMIQYLDTEGNPCWVHDKTLNYSQYELEFNRFGQLSTIRYCALTGAPISEMRMSYDERGQCISYQHYNSAGKLRNGPDGYATENIVYDEHGRKTSVTYLDENGNYIIGDSYLFLYDRDARGNVVLIASCSLEEDGRTVMGALQTKYDSKGNDAERLFVELVDDEVVAYDVTEYEYDERNRVIKISSYSDFETEASHVVEFAYDARNRTVSRLSYQLSNGAYELKERHEYKCDQYGFISEEWFYDGDGNAYTDDEGISASVMQHDAMGNITRIEFRNSQNQPIYRASVGYAIADREYNSLGMATHMICYDESGELMTRESGMPASILWAYDQMGYRTEETVYDELGQLFATEKYGAARTEICNDAGGYQTYYALYDEKNELTEECVGILYISEVVEDSIAEKAGMQPYDILLRIGSWDFFSYGSYQDVQLSDMHNVSDELLYSEKDIIICRPHFDVEPATYDLQSFHVGPGAVGVGFSIDAVLDINDADIIKDLYLRQFGSP